MATRVIDELITKYTLDPSGYVKGSTTVTQRTKTVLDGSSKAQSAISQLNGSYKIFSASLNAIEAFGAGILATTALVGGIAVTAMGKAGEFEALTMALQAVTGSAKDAQAELKKLWDIAKAPGVGFQESIEAFTLLKRQGLSTGFSERAIREFANLNAGSGGGQEQFQRIMLAISQIATKPYLKGQELMQLSEQRVPAYKMIKDAFGTTDTEELQRRGVTSGQVLEAMLTALEKTTRVGGSAKNSFENLGQAIEQAWIAGGSALNKELIPFIDRLGDTIVKFTQEGGIQSTFEAMAESAKELLSAFGADGLQGALLDAGAGLLTLTQHLEYFYLNLQEIWNHLPISWVLGQMKDISNFDMNRKDLEAVLKTNELSRKIYGKKGDEKQSDEKQDKQTTALDKIATNTKDTVQQLQHLERNIFGGGDVGRMGVTPTEVGAITGRHGGGSHRTKQRANEIASIIANAMDQAALDALTRARRAGLAG